MTDTNHDPAQWSGPPPHPDDKRSLSQAIAAALAALLRAMRRLTGTAEKLTDSTGVTAHVAEISAAERQSLLHRITSDLGAYRDAQDQYQLARDTFTALLATADTGEELDAAREELGAGEIGLLVAYQDAAAARNVTRRHLGPTEGPIWDIEGQMADLGLSIAVVDERLARLGITTPDYEQRELLHRGVNELIAAIDADAAEPAPHSERMTEAVSRLRDIACHIHGVDHLEPHPLDLAIDEVIVAGFTRGDDTPMDANTQLHDAARRLQQVANGIAGPDAPQPEHAAMSL